MPLNTDRLGASTTSLGSLCLTTLSVKKGFLSSFLLDLLVELTHPADLSSLDLV